MSTSPVTQVNKFLRWIGFDQALSYAIWGKLWQVFAGPITILMIARYLNPESQGYYYAFMSIVATGALIEFGFYTIIIQFASHEWSELHLDSKGNITGNPKAISRLVSLGRLVFKWHLFVACFFIVVVGIGGFFGILLGAIAGYWGGWTDEIISRLDSPIKNSLEILEISKLISERLEIFQQICLVNLIQTIWWRKTKNIALVKKLENLKHLLRKNIQPRLAWEITFLKISMEDILD